MRLLVLSHKEVWHDSSSPSGYATIGGFPFQMQAISNLFDQTCLLLLKSSIPPPNGLKPLVGHNLMVQALPEPQGKGFLRKLAFFKWLPRYYPVLWKSIQISDAIHAPVPGDLGLIGILLALIAHKPLFVRHCGTWAKPQSLADRFLFLLLEKIAGGKNVVLATGGGSNPPSKNNPGIHWIFSSSLTQTEMESLPAHHPWEIGLPLRLVTVARLTHEKNTHAILHALSILKANFFDISLSVVGDGPERSALEALAKELNLSNQIVFHSNCSHADVLKILSESHLFIFPTRVREGFPKAVLEAMACGLPVIASNVSIIPGLIFDCGRVLDYPFPENIAEAVNDILSKPDSLFSLGIRARQKSKNYTLEAWQDKIADYLRTSWNM
jgi:glycosyltransferase involved in cell wall biosynthesis